MNLFFCFGFPPERIPLRFPPRGGLGLGSATYQLNSQAGPTTFDDLPKEPILRVGGTHRHSELQGETELMSEFLMSFCVMSLMDEPHEKKPWNI